MTAGHGGALNTYPCLLKLASDIALRTALKGVSLILYWSFIFPCRKASSLEAGSYVEASPAAVEERSGWRLAVPDSSGSQIAGSRGLGSQKRRAGILHGTREGRLLDVLPFGAGACRSCKSNAVQGGAIDATSAIIA